MIDLFTYAKSLRNAGMASAEQHSPEFSVAAYEAIERVAQRQVHIHVDDILSEDVPAPNHPNAWGAVWARAIRNRVIQRTTETRLCKTDIGKHAHRYPVYFSLIYDPRVKS